MLGGLLGLFVQMLSVPAFTAMTPRCLSHPSRLLFRVRFTVLLFGQIAILPVSLWQRKQIKSLLLDCEFPRLGYHVIYIFPFSAPSTVSGAVIALCDLWPNG